MLKLYFSFFALFSGILFADFDAPVDVFTGVDPKEIVVSDMNGDGLNDIVFVDQGSIKIIHKGNINENNYSVSLDGIDESFFIPNDASLKQSNYTFSTWVNFKSGMEGKVYSYLWSSDSLKIKHHVVDKWINCRVYFSDGSTDSVSIQGDLISHDTWHHFVFSFDSSSGMSKVYLDGNLAVSKDLGTGIPLDNGTEIYLGGDSYLPYSFAGLMDDSAYFSSTLSDIDVIKLFNFGNYVNVAAVDETGTLVSWWKMGDSEQDSFNSYFGTPLLKDESVGGNDAIPHNTEPSDKVEASYSN